MISGILRRWRGLRPRWRAMLALMASVALLAGAWLASGWRAESWPAKVELRSPPETWPLAFSPDGRLFATSGLGGITLWDTSTGRERGTWKVEQGRFANAGAFSPDGRTFAASLNSYPRPLVIALIDVPSGRTRATLTAQHTNSYDLGFSADGKALRLLSGDRNGFKDVATWDAATGEPISTRTPSLPSPGNWLLAASPDGRILAFRPPRRGPIWLMDSETDRPLPIPAGLASASIGQGAGFSRDGRLLAIGRGDGAIDLWDLPAQRLVKTLKAHKGGYASVAIRFAPDGRTIASRGEPVGGTPGLSRVWRDLTRNLYGHGSGPSTEVVIMDLSTGERLARSGTSIHPFYSPDGRTIATREFDHSVRLRDIPAPAR